MTSQNGNVSPATTDAVTKVKAPLKDCDGQLLKRMLEASTTWLDYNSQAINALNVFPVPDGDTGTNMLLTMRSAIKEVATSPEHSVAEIAHAVARGALMGARGNSGVILSQILRGFAHGLDQTDQMHARDFAIALRQAADTAYQAVIKPVEGTILTVIEDMAQAAHRAAGENDDLYSVWEGAVDAARHSVARTPLLLPVLRDAGVVDAGGQGLFVVFDGALRFLRGESIDAATQASGPQNEAQFLASEGYGYDIQFLLRGKDLDVDVIRAKIDSMGESTLVVGDSSLIKVHVHAPNPGPVIQYAADLGPLSKVIIENMDEQYQDFMLGTAATPSQSAALELTDIATVAVVPGEGLRQVFESLGVTAVVPGGQSMNPSTEQLLRAIDEVSSDYVILLPNNRNVILAANQAQSLSQKHVAVVPTQTIPQGICALVSFKYQADLEANVQAMERAMGEIQTGEITKAVRSTRVDGMQVEEGEYMALLNGKLVAAGANVAGVVNEMLRQIGAEDYELFTIYYGDEVEAGEAEELAGMIRTQYPDQEVELVDGGQPLYPYIISAE